MKNSELLRAWFELEKRYHSLVDMKLFASNKARGADLETFCGECLDMIFAPNLDLPDLDEQMRTTPPGGLPPGYFPPSTSEIKPEDRNESLEKPIRNFSFESFRQTIKELGLKHE